MKYTLCLVVVLSPFLAMSQKVTVGLGGGASINGKPSYVDQGSYATSLNPAFKIEALYCFGSFQVGLQMGYQKLTQKSDSWFINGQGANLESGTATIAWAAPAFSFDAIVNYKILSKGSYPFAGISLGYLAGKERTSKAEKGYNAPASGGPQLGLNVGYAHSIGSFEIVGQLSPRIAFMKYGSADGLLDENYSIGYIPLTIGIRYKL